MGDSRDHVDETRIYPPANECIYCGATGAPLSDEHTVPDGLGGRHILPKASCDVCQKIINEEFEQYCMRTLFSNVRAMAGMRSRKNRQPTRTSVQVRRPSGALERVYLDPDNLPRFFVLPAFEEPRFLTGKPITDTYEGAWWIQEPAESKSILASLGAEAIQTETIFPDKLARLVAKIAHAHAWALWGPVFEPYLVPIILGQQKRFIEFVGGWVKGRDSTPDLHHEFGITYVRREGRGKDHLVARLRFFSDWGTPEYYAVIGRALRPWPFPERQGPPAER